MQYAKRRRSLIGLIFAGLIVAGIAIAQDVPDELRLRNGTVLKGRVVDVDRNTVTFRADDGVKEYKRSDVYAIFFSGEQVAEGEFPPGFSAKPPLKLKRVITFHQITSNKVADQKKFEPDVAKISANGEKIAFWSRGSGLYSINSDGTGQTLVWANNNDHNAVQADRFELSPDGKVIYWETPSYGAIRRVNADGTNMKTLVNSGAEYEPLRLRQAGKRIFFGSRAGIFSIDTDGNGDYRTIIDPKKVGQLEDMDPNDNTGRTFLQAFDVSEDGSRMVFTIYDSKAKMRQLAAINTNGTGFRNLTKTDFEPGYLSMTPDGNQIVFWKAAEKAFLINWDGTGLRELPIPIWDANAPSFQHLDRFTPDSKSFAYEGGEAGGGPKILRMDNLEFYEPTNIGRLDYFAEAMFQGMFPPSYSSDQRRFATISQFFAPARPRQLIVGDVNPRSADAIPVLSDIEFPDVLSINPQLPTHSGQIKVRAKPGTGDIQRVWFLLTPDVGKNQGRPDRWVKDMGWWALDGNHIAHDDGKDGDAVKGDGIFTGTLTADAGDSKVLPGRYTLRIVAHDDLNAVIVDVDGIEIK
ncbi:MAG TPA: hypothetical protein VKY31_02280 [Terriglobia bacterium]|nr:hypothetical protein [Terriglobia bacterium]